MSGCPNMIEIFDLEKRYRLDSLEIPVLRGITLAIRRSEMVAIMGASGSGKTTLMNILGCMDRPTAGRYLLDGEEITGLSSDRLARIRNSKIGFVFQNFNLLPRTSALENVAMPLLYATGRYSERKGRRRAVELLERVGLADRLRHEPSQLSGGQQQRVAIARALVNNPEILLADEPTGNLDSQTSVEILGMFRHFNSAEGITILLITHDPQVVSYANRVIFIRDGKLAKPSDGVEAGAVWYSGDGGGIE